MKHEWKEILYIKISWYFKKLIFFIFFFLLIWIKVNMTRNLILFSNSKLWIKVTRFGLLGELDFNVIFRYQGSKTKKNVPTNRLRKNPNRRNAVSMWAASASTPKPELNHVSGLHLQRCIYTVTQNNQEPYKCIEASWRTCRTWQSRPTFVVTYMYLTKPFKFLSVVDAVAYLLTCIFSFGQNKSS